ncbi:MAG: tRNA pseudouridine(38-40) synthase TruA [Chloroflexota bacterium]|nr:tRNA pseudouridine(38-40) synthase TruA [Chloroflexota bacterium]
MKRFVAKIAYDGTGYFGFQRQPEPTATVQRALERAIARVTRQQISVLAAGRTDTGVHALGQTIAFDADWKHAESDLLRAINAELPMDIAVQELWQQDGFHPRFDALWRQYVYRIATPTARNPLLNGRAWQLVGGSMDLGALQEAAALCLGEQDFAAFGTAPQEGSGNTTREVFASRWDLEENEQGCFYRYRVRATAFLYHMVRRMVGTMAHVGLGKIDLKEFEEILLSRDIQRAKVLAPAMGLILEEVGYPSPVGQATIARRPCELATEAELE